MVTSALFVLPLVVRGELLAKLVRGRLPPLCGRVELQGLSVSPGVAFDLLIGRPFGFTVDHLRIDDAEGSIVLAAARLEGRLRILRAPLRLSVETLDVSNGQWVMAGKPGIGLTLLGAFRSPGHCRSAEPSRPTASAEAAGDRHSVEVHGVHLHAMDVTFAFRDWELSLARTEAEGRLELAWGGRERDGLSFEATKVEAGPSRLRIGREGEAFMTRVPFARVSLARVAVDPAQPNDLALEVTAAHTGKAVLAGRAVFRDVFVHGRPPRPGLDLDATWTDFAEAAQALEARWQGLVVTTMGTTDVRLHATAHGPFQSLAATLEATTDTLHMTVSLDAERNLRARWTLRDFDTATRLPPALRPLLAGRARGHFTLTAKLAPRLADMAARISEVSLDLTRARPGPFPPRFSLHLPGLTTNNTNLAPSPDTLAFDVDAASLAHGNLTLEDLHTAWLGMRATASAKVGLIKGPFHGEAHLHVRGVDLGRVWPAGPVAGRLDIDTELSGSEEDLQLTLTFPGERRLLLQGRTVTLPRQTRAWLRQGDTVVLPRLTLEGAGGARLTLSGDAVADGPLHARLALVHVPLTWLAVASADTTRAPAVTGSIDGNVLLEGPTRAPSWSGTLDGSSLRAWGVACPPAHVAFRKAGTRTLFNAGMGDALSVAGDARLGPSPRLNAHLTLAGFSFAPWLGTWLGTSPLGKLDLRVSGHGDANVDKTGLHWKVSLPSVEARAGALVLVSSGPWEAFGTREQATLTSATMQGEGLDFSLAGQLHAGVLDAHAQGSLVVSPWMNTLLRSTPLRLHDGRLELSLRATGTLTQPTMQAEARVASPLRGSVRWQGHPPLPLRVNAGIVRAASALTALGRREASLAAEGVDIGFPGGGVKLAGSSNLEGEGEGPAGKSPNEPRPPTAIRHALGNVPSWVSRLSGELRVAGQSNLNAWLPWLPPATLTRAEGVVAASLQLGVARGVPTLVAHVASDRISLRTPLLSSDVDVRHFAWDTDGEGWKTTPFEVALGAGGPIRLALEGNTDRLAPRLSLSAEGSGVKSPVPLGRVSFESSDFDLRLRGPGPSQRYRLSGQVLVRGARLSPSAPPGSKKLLSGNSDVTHWLRLIDLDLSVKSPDITAVAPGPDLTLSADCRVVGPLLAPVASGDIRGRGAYSRTAFALYDWLAGSHLRHCAP